MKINKQQIAWWLWAIGTVLIALSWFNVVRPAVGWCGFAIGMLGSVVGWGLTPPHNPPVATASTARSEDKDNEA